MKKKLYFGIMLLLMISMIGIVAYASVGGGFFIINDFSKGYNPYANPYNLPPNQCQAGQNMRYDNIYGALSKRSPILSYGTVGTDAVDSIFRYYLSSGSKYLIATYSTYLKYGSDSAGTFTTLHDQATDSQRFSFLTYQDEVIALNGVDAPLKWDGSTTTTANTDGARTASNLMAELGGPYAELNTGSHLEASKWYAYQMAYYDSANAVYSYCTNHSNLILTGTTVTDIALTGVPLGETGTTERVIYRTEGYASRALLLTALSAEALYYCGEISDNSTKTFSDTVADSDLDDDDAPTWATASAGTDVTPPTAKYGIVHGERIFLARTASNKSHAYWSEVYKPNWFDTGTDYEIIRQDDGDDITFLKDQLGILTIGKTNTIQKWYTRGTPSTDWYVSDVFSFIGCPAPFTAQNTPAGIIYLGRHGIYLFDGQYSQLISETVTPDIQDINQTYIENSYGAYSDNKYNLSYVSTSIGGTTNNTILVYDVSKDIYFKDTLNINCFATFDSGTDTGNLYAGASDTTGYVWIYPPLGSFNLFQNLKSQYDAGTVTDIYVGGEENSPILTIGHSEAIDDYSGTIADSEDLIDRPGTTGSYISPVLLIDANSLVKLFWGEELTAYGELTWQIRTGATSSACSSASWSTNTFTDPYGSDLSGETSNTYIQFKASFTTSSTSYSPALKLNDEGFVLKLIYLKGGTEYESVIYSIWESGWTDFQIPGQSKIIRYVKIFYDAPDEAGSFILNIENGSGDISESITVDLSITPSSDSTDEYLGSTSKRIYFWQPGIETVSSPWPKGEYFKFKITDTGAYDYNIFKIVVRYDVEEEIY